MRVALFGGTFDPPHNGHIAIAKAAADTFALDRILFAPTGLQPLKLDRVLSPFALRLGLASAACQEDSCFSVTEIDSPHADGSPNYTVDTLAALRALYPGHALFNLVGADAFLSLHQWRGSEHLLDLAEWIVATRPGYDLSEQDLAPLDLTPTQRTRVHILSGSPKTSPPPLSANACVGETPAAISCPSTSGNISRGTASTQHPPNSDAGMSESAASKHFRYT